MATEYPVTCDYDGKVFDSLDSLADSMEMLRTHIAKEHTYTATCQYCDREFTTEGLGAGDAQFLANKHVEEDHFGAECVYCGERRVSTLGLEDAKGQIHMHILDAHPGIINA